MLQFDPTMDRSHWLLASMSSYTLSECWTLPLCSLPSMGNYTTLLPPMLRIPPAGNPYTTLCIHHHWYCNLCNGPYAVHKSAFGRGRDPDSPCETPDPWLHRIEPDSARTMTHSVTVSPKHRSEQLLGFQVDFWI